MSMSTGDVRRPSKLSGKAAAGDKPEAEVTTDSSAPSDSAPSTSAPSESAPSTSASSESAPTAKSRPKKASSPGASSSSASRPSGKPSAARKTPAKTGGGKGRRPVTPVKVSQGMNWGPIAMFGGAGLLALLIIGFAVYPLIKKATEAPWQERAGGIEGISNYLQSNPEWFKPPAEGNHKPGVLSYPTNPPVGGVHNPMWQNCMGDVYDAQIPKEQAVHSMEHGAVWVTYRPDLPKDQIDKLATKVRNQSFMLMSPYPDLDRPISLQAWGYQLKLDNADDGRIDDFIEALRQNATQEPQAKCSDGITDTGAEPLNLTPPQQPGQPGS
jgi:hypothetical protein